MVLFLRILILAVCWQISFSFVTSFVSVRQRLHPTKTLAFFTSKSSTRQTAPLFSSSYRRRPSSSSSSDLDDRLSFKQIVKIDPNLQTPISEVNCSSITKTTLEKKGFTALTPIQSQSYDYILSGADIIGRSRTGTGKTLAFGLPIIERLLHHPAILRRQKERGRKPLVLVLEPTRELAIQVAAELSAVGGPHGLRVSCVYGGASFLKQEEELRYQGCDVVVATPGRLLDHLTQHTIDLTSVAHVVLDEGDTMLEMGFQEDVESILEQISVTATSSETTSKKRRGGGEEVRERGDVIGFSGMDDSDDISAKKVQMLLFSATMPSWIVSMTNRLMTSPIFLDAIQEGETRLAATIKHLSILLPDESAYSATSPRQRGRGDRVEQVRTFLEDVILSHTTVGTPSEITSTSEEISPVVPVRRGQQTIIFTNTKEEADRLLSLSCFQYFTSQVLHGDVSQYMRQKTLQLFRQQHVDILISTDVAARGLDIQGVDLVIHLYPPKDVDSYVHRSGRTGRAGRNGTAIVFHTKGETGLMNLLQRKLKFTFQGVGLPLPSDITRACATIVDEKLADVEEDTVTHFLPYAQRLLARQLPQDRADVIDSIASDGKLAELMAKCMAAISQRSSITVRSLVTGREGFLTLAFSGAFIKKSPELWNKFLLYYLGKILAIERFATNYAKLPSAVIYAQKDSGPLLLVDFEEELAEQIVERAKHLSYPEEVGVAPCTALPDYVQWQQATSEPTSYSSSRGGGGSGVRFSSGGDRQRSSGGWRGSGGISGDRGSGGDRGSAGGSGSRGAWSSDRGGGGDRGSGARWSSEGRGSDRGGSRSSVRSTSSTEGRGGDRMGRSSGSRETRSTW